MREIKHIFEPNPLACGQAVVSMITGVDVAEVIRIAGTDREITLADMKFLLSRFGLELSPERRQAQTASDLPAIALLSLETPKCWHWSLYAAGKFYDPEYGVLIDFPVCHRKYFWEIQEK